MIAVANLERLLAVSMGGDEAQLVACLVEERDRDALAWHDVAEVFIKVCEDILKAQTTIDLVEESFDQRRCPFGARLWHVQDSLSGNIFGCIVAICKWCVILLQQTVPNGPLFRAIKAKHPWKMHMLFSPRSNDAETKAFLGNNRRFHRFEGVALGTTTNGDCANIDVLARELL
jgi:hypothetical protein